MSKLWFCILALLASGCAYKDGSSYPTAYKTALTETKGVTPSTTDIDKWISFFSQFQPDNSNQNIAVTEVYAKTVYFSDSLMHTNRLEDIATHFEGLRSNGTTVSLQILNTIIQNQDAYVIWQMDSQFKPLFRSVKSVSIGATHLRFNSEGKVVLHQDFWDTGFGFYRHIPALGTAIKAIETRFAIDTTES